MYPNTEIYESNVFIGRQIVLILTGLLSKQLSIKNDFSLSKQVLIHFPAVIINLLKIQTGEYIEKVDP